LFTYLSNKHTLIVLQKLLENEQKLNKPDKDKQDKT